MSEGISSNQKRLADPMKPQRLIAIPTAIFGMLLFTPLMHAQGRGMRGSSSGIRSRSSFRVSRGGDFDRQSGRRFENGFGFPFAPFFYPDYYSGGDADYRDAAPEAQPTQTHVVQQPPAPPPPPGDTLILENHDGQWVRIPIGAEMVKASASAKVENSAGTGLQAANAEVAVSEISRAPLPPAVLVFRDGHSEEVQKYVIQGANLYATAGYSTTGSWTKKIPLADLDIPASLKVNNDRGTKFNLPSGPNEVVIRF
jgi:hypothetical protein